MMSSVKIPNFFSFILPFGKMIALIIKEFPIIVYNATLLEYAFLSDSLLLWAFFLVES